MDSSLSVEQQSIREAVREVCRRFPDTYWRELDVERKFRETKLLEVAPVSNNLVLAYLGQHVLGMPRSY